jgi:hypothetical protein
MTPEFKNYLDSYEHRSSAWVERVQRTGNDVPGLDPQREKPYERVTEQNYPKIYKALEEECAFRRVEMPACYVDATGETRLGRALQEDYTLLIDKRSNDMFSDGEMRALMAHELKHLYQGKIETTEQSIAAEYDSDRAAVTSTDYATIKSYVDKAIHMMIDDNVPTGVLRKFVHGVHHTFPGLIAENFMIQIDEYHPSPANRMRAMREEYRKSHNQDGRQ